VKACVETSVTLIDYRQKPSESLRRFPAPNPLFSSAANLAAAVDLEHPPSMRISVRHRRAVGRRIDPSPNSEIE
jgi:hypothetical protein